MQILGIGNNQAFTLIEVVLVMFMIGVLTGLVVLSVPDKKPDAYLEEEAERIKTLISLVQEESMLQAKPWGIGFTQDQYMFFALEELVWQLINEDELFAARELNKNIEVKVFIEGLDIVLEEDAEKLKRPQIFILPSGEMLPDFTISLITKDNNKNHYDIEINKYGLPIISQ